MSNGNKDPNRNTILVVTREEQESVTITIPGETPDKNVTVQVIVTKLQGNTRARLAFIAPAWVKVTRTELEPKTEPKKDGQ